MKAVLRNFKENIFDFDWYVYDRNAKLFKIIRIDIFKIHLKFNQIIK